MYLCISCAFELRDCTGAVFDCKNQNEHLAKRNHCCVRNVPETRLEDQRIAPLLQFQVIQ